MSITTNKRIAIFYHCAEMNNWKEIDAEIMEVLKTSGLLERADIFVKNNCKDIGLYEFPTLELLDQFCVYHQDYYVLYIMNKGVSRPTSNQSSDWRKCMLYWNVERWKECVAKLDEGFEAVGINVVETPHRHFQGNFWWTTAKHIASLGNINDIEVKEDKELDIGERHKAEFWVLSKPTLVYSPYHHHINPYIEINPRDNYINKKF